MKTYTELLYNLLNLPLSFWVPGWEITSFLGFCFVFLRF